MKTPAIPDLGTVFFGSYRRQVLGLLLLHPDEAFHLREIARVTRTQPGTLRRELALLADAGVLSREAVGNLILYRADPACPIYEELRGILKKTTGVVEVLHTGLAPLASGIVTAFIFGSVSRGSERRVSDVDVMVVGEVSFEKVVSAMIPCQTELRREINPAVLRPADFKKKMNVRDSFLVRVLREPLIFILGGNDELEKLGANRKGAAT